MRPIGTSLNPLIALVLFVFVGISSAVAQPVFPNVTVETVATGLRSPWALTQLPDGQWLISEKSGSIVLLSENNQKQYLGDVPPDIYVAGQGGLLDIELHPDFAQNGFVYITYAAGEPDANYLAIARAVYAQGSLAAWERLFSVNSLKDTPVHYAGRLAFLADGSLLVSVGDGFDYREDAQRNTSMLGKILRLSDTGEALADNPFYTGAGGPQDFIYSLGHRNMQGLVYDAKNNQVLAHEHGPAGGDEINVITAGANYGWPVVTRGKDYSGANISPFETYPGMVEPIVNWTPSIAPAGMVQYRGEELAELDGDLLITALKPPHFHWVRIQNGERLIQKPVVGSLAMRLRDVAVGQGGAVYLLTDGDDASLLRMTSAD
ncbi:PQQ-dependent sugar dehydrogenase [Alteromonas oceanisediminis]|uniref:PQQ-dependent sugar dehydrogenase n=1 Tax=Alteromonas oceanisediminis TaxID=2836180 RepID=UPI001BDA412B|nr:PQQ-dependent sugar dehydrogenase [Alteromonas oceanisediminis]MBT0585272.1 PQQ-dependent sugar dehydrogenase [Alteromonas oceanisediminis]